MASRHAVLDSLFTRDEEFLSVPSLYPRYVADKGWLVGGDWLGGESERAAFQPFIWYPFIVILNICIFPLVYETRAQKADMSRLYEVDPDADTLLIVHHTSEVTKNSGSVVNGHKDDGLINGISEPHINGQHFSTELRIKVSSKHLSLASRHLSNKLRHTAAVQSDGRIHIHLDDVDPAAAIVVMNIIHCRGQKAPRAVTLQTLADIAVFVDRYRCFDAVEAHVDRWIRGLEHDLVEAPVGKALMQWIYVAYVFRQPSLFKRVTGIAVSQSTEIVGAYGLPVRQKIINGINRQRQQLLIQAADAVNDALGCSREVSVCSLGCDEFLRNAFQASINRSGVPWPPNSAIDGAGFGVLIEASGEIEKMHENWHSNIGPVFAKPLYSSKPSKPETHSPESGQRQTIVARQPQCIERLRLTDHLRKVEREAGGLELESSLGYSLY
ncbi:hypothetical protein PspLS_01971 [Pyricularia sp. CBS 133598]|nr:hypothetical protein PspLS_01971 [Pyricularia sp. CBS 133598]